MEFNNKVFATWHIFGLDVWVTETTINTWIITFFLCMLSIIAYCKIKKFNDVPSGFQNFIEMIVEFVDNLVTSNMGEKYSYFGNLFFGMFLFIFASNLSGLVGLRPPTADLATTAAFALITFFLIHFMGILKAGKSYFKSYIEPTPILLPINIISEFATPVSLSFRLFGNILGGLIIMNMVYSLFPWFLKLGLPGVFHIYFDIFAGTLQAFLFIMLSMTFIRDKIPE